LAQASRPGEPLSGSPQGPPTVVPSACGCGRLLFASAGQRVAHAPIGDSLARSMKNRERSKSGAGSFIAWGLPRGVQQSIRNSTPHAVCNRPHPDTGAAATAAAALPTHSGRYVLPFFHRPHRVAARARATFRRASFAVRPCSIHLPCKSAKGLFPVATADNAAPRMVFFSRRCARRGTPKCSGPFPERCRSRPMPRYFHKADLLRYRHGVAR
jgi:hypothetical protein